MFSAFQAAWDNSDTLFQLPGIGPAQASRLRSKGVSTLRDLALRGEASARKLLENCGLASQSNGAAGGRSRGGGGRGGDGEGSGGVGAALRALAAIPVVKDAVFDVHPAGKGGRKGVSMGTTHWMCRVLVLSEVVVLKLHKKTVFAVTYLYECLNFGNTTFFWNCRL